MPSLYFQTPRQAIGPSSLAQMMRPSPPRVQEILSVSWNMPMRAMVIRFPQSSTTFTGQNIRLIERSRAACFQAVSRRQGLCQRRGQASFWTRISWTNYLNLLTEFREESIRMRHIVLLPKLSFPIPIMGSM